MTVNNQIYCSQWVAFAGNQQYIWFSAKKSHKPQCDCGTLQTAIKMGQWPSTQNAITWGGYRTSNLDRK